MTRNLDVATLHELAREARANMTPGEIAHAAKVARANMRLCAKAKEAWRRQCREELDTGDPLWRSRFESIRKYGRA
jgi:hypothetical protein